MKPSTLTDYRSVAARLVDTFGSLPIEGVTAQRIEDWRAGLGAGREHPLTNRTRNKSLTILGGIMERARRVYGLHSNPVRDVEKSRERYDATRRGLTSIRLRRCGRWFGRRYPSRTARSS